MQSFLREGYEVIAIAPQDAEVEKKLAEFNINYFSIPMARNGLNPFADLSLIYQLWRILWQEKPQSVFTYTIKPIIYGSIAARLAGIKQIYSMVTGTGYVFLNTNLKSKIVGTIAQNLFRVGLQFNKLIYFQNKDNLEFFRCKKIISKRKPAMVINGSGVDCNVYQPVPYPNDISFLMIARFLYDKGIREYVEAARMIKAHYPAIKCRLIGWIDTNPNSISAAELESWIEEGIIDYLGKLDDVRPAIAQSAVYVLPSYHEGTPRTVLEAMAMSRPIITTDTMGCRETVIPEKNGFLVPVQNVPALYRAMEYFILSPHEIQKMGEESRKLAVEKYDVNKVNHTILKGMGITTQFKKDCA